MASLRRSNRLSLALVHVCNTLQRTATHYMTKQHKATYCSILQHTTAHDTYEFGAAFACFSHWYVSITLCNSLQHTATHCNTLRHTATHCNTLQHTSTHYSCEFDEAIACFSHWYVSATHCNARQHTATTCNTLKHTAAHCNTLQHTATRCNTLQHTTVANSAQQSLVSRTGMCLQHTVKYYNTLRHTASHCNNLQHTARHPTHSNILQHTPTLCNTLQRTHIKADHSRNSKCSWSSRHCNTLLCCSVLQCAAAC